MRQGGSPLPEEAGIASPSDDIEQTEALARAFGVSSLENLDGTQEFTGVSVVDETDDSSP